MLAAGRGLAAEGGALEPDCWAPGWARRARALIAGRVELGELVSDSLYRGVQPSRSCIQAFLTALQSNLKNSENPTPTTPGDSATQLVLRAGRGLAAEGGGLEPGC